MQLRYQRAQKLADVAEQRSQHVFWENISPTIYQVHHQNLLQLENLASAQKMDYVSNYVTGVLPVKKHFVWSPVLKNISHEFLDLF